MGTLITDDILNEFAVVGEPDEAVEKFKGKFGDMIDRTTANFAANDEDHHQALMAKLRA